MADGGLFQTKGCKSNCPHLQSNSFVQPEAELQTPGLAMMGWREQRKHRFVQTRMRKASLLAWPTFQ